MEKMEKMEQVEPRRFQPNTVVLPGSNRPTRPNARVLGKADAAKRITVSIYARKNPHAGTQAAPSLTDLTALLPRERQYLNDKEFTASFGADQGELDKIAQWAKASRLNVVESNARSRRVRVEGTIADINSAFGTELMDYEHPRYGRYRGRQGDLYIPADLSGIVEGVFGLDNRRVGRPRLRRANVISQQLSTHSGGARRGNNGSHLRPSPWPGTFFPPQLAQLYDFPPDLDGTGQNVAIFAFNGGTQGDPHGGYKLSVLKTYFEHVLGGKTPNIKDVVVQGPGNNPGPDTEASGNSGDATGEVMLDMCVVGAMAPGAKIFMYFTEFTSQGWVDALHDAISGDNDIAVVSISYGNPEDDPQGAWTSMGVKVVNQAFEAAIARGITICCASGDDGSSDQVQTGAHTDFPASSPYVLGVGGTKLVATDSSTPRIADETVWNEMLSGNGSTGGGVSAVFSKPSYQDGAKVPPSTNPPHRIGRGVPDVCADADPQTGVVRMNISGKGEPTGGTSAAAPLWAALIARLNQGLNARCGFLNEVLYTKFAKGVLNDITSGNNGAYAAGPGWDACTGLGSPDGEKLLQALSGSRKVKQGRTNKRRK
jgi:kumamolisin